ncbi:hypothetical protein C8R47DRAFT_1080572 [Mycena vitilis]|nr:hypothetical protein C8R47DRAFT_1080572 [Mycena vitilis]
MWLLTLLCAFPLVSPVQINTTIDDASPLVTYRAVIDRNLTGFDPATLNNGTVTFIPATAKDSPTISMNFTGTAIYVYIAYPAGHNESFTSGFISRIDGVPYGGWAAANTAPFTHHLAYHNTTMPNGPHNFVMQIQPEWELYFDYAVYTSGDPIPVKQRRKFPVGAVVGGIVGGLFLLALLASPFLLRWRVRSRQKPIPFVEQHQTEDEAEKAASLPLMTPFLLQSAPSPRVRKGNDRDTLTVGIPDSPRTKSLGSTERSPLSAASDPAFILMADEIRRLRERLETAVPATSAGEQALQRPPPAYGSEVI